jgi:hypothetical protein
LLRFARNDVDKSEYVSAISRHDMPELCKKPCPRNLEGAGKTGCALHPRSRVQCASKKTHTSIQVQRKHSGLPCAMALRLMPCSPRRRIRLVTVADGLAVHRNPVGLRKTSASLTPATGARTTRFCRTQPPGFAKRLRRAFAGRLHAAFAHGPKSALRPRPRARRCRVHRIPPHVRDDGQRPSERDRMGGHSH